MKLPFVKLDIFNVLIFVHPLKLHATRHLIKKYEDIINQIDPYNPVVPNAAPV